MLTPSSFVLQKFQGMPSGFFLTSDDNSWGHFLIKMYTEYRLFGSGKPFREVYDHWLQNFSCALYADDQLESWTEEVNPIYNVENVSRCYKECGAILKLEDDVVQRSLEGLTFLGSKIAKFRYLGESYYVPLKERDFAFCHAYWQEGHSESKAMTLTRLLGLLSELPFDDFVFNKIRQVCCSLWIAGVRPVQEYVEFYTEVTNLPREFFDGIPLQKTLIDHYLGNE